MITTKDSDLCLSITKGSCLQVFAVHLVPKKVFILEKGELKPSERTKPVQFHVDVNIKQVNIQPYECNTQPYAQTSVDFRNLNRWGFVPSRGG